MYRYIDMFVDGTPGTRVSSDAYALFDYLSKTVDNLLLFGRSDGDASCACVP